MPFDCKTADSIARITRFRRPRRGTEAGKIRAASARATSDPSRTTPPVRHGSRVVSKSINGVSGLSEFSLPWLG